MRIKFMPLFLLCFFLAGSFQVNAKSLDVDGLKSNIAKRVSTMIGENYPTDYIQITKQIPVEIPINDSVQNFYAIRADLQPINEDQKPGKLTFLVDQNGRTSFAGAKDLITGESVAKDALMELSKIELPQNFGNELISGKGDHQITLVSDPFCPFCRKAYDFFTSSSLNGKINTLKIVHMPLDMHPGAKLLCNAVHEASQDSKIKISERELTDFIYEIAPIRSKTDRIKLMEKMLNEFPALADAWGTPENAMYFIQGKYSDKKNKDIELATKEYGITGTPAVFIDGVLVQGFNLAKIKDLMGMSNVAQK